MQYSQEQQPQPAQPTPPKQHGGDFNDFMTKANELRRTPKDPYSHALLLLEPEKKQYTELIDVLNRLITLGNFEDSQTLRLFQKDIKYILKFFLAKQREPSLEPLFQYAYTLFLGEIMVTRGMEGQERIFQYFGNAMPNKPIGKGFGKKSMFGKKKRLTPKQKMEDAFLGNDYE